MTTNSPKRLINVSFPVAWENRYYPLQKVADRRVSSVYKALDQQTGQFVAVKRLETTGLVTASEKRQSLEQFKNEATRLETLSRLGIVGILAHTVEKETGYVVMQWLEGRTLLELHREGPMTDVAVRDLGQQLATALAFLHEQNPPIVLRDLKLSHILMDNEGVAWLLDLGLSRFFQPGQSRNAANRGTVPFEAPEQAEFGYAVPESDIYALGSILLALAKGPAGSTAPALSPSLTQVINRARQKEAEKRFPSARAMAQALSIGRQTQTPNLESAAAAPVSHPSLAEPTLSLMTQVIRIVRTPDKQRIGYHVRLRNITNQPASAVIKSNLNWLSVQQDHLEVPANSIAQFTVVADMKAAPKQASKTRNAILIESGTRLGIAVEIAEAEPKMEIQPETLDFGEIAEGVAQAALTIRNGGGGLLTVNAKSAFEWLRLTHSSVSLGEGQAQDIVVELEPSRAPTPGLYERAIRLESDYGQAWAGARFARGSAAILLKPEAIDFGVIENNQPVSARVLVANPGTATLYLKARSEHPALVITPASVAIPARHQMHLNLELNPENLTPGAVSLQPGVSFSGNGLSAKLLVKAFIARPLLAINDTYLDFGEVTPDETAKKALTLVLANRGSVALQYQVQSQEQWLQAWPESGELLPATSTVLEVSLLPQKIATPGVHENGAALLITGAGGSLPIAAKIELVKPILSVEPTALDFGMVLTTGVGERSLYIRNTGTGKLPWQANTDAAWLEISPSNGQCDPTDMQTVQVRAYALGLPKETQQAKAQIQIAGPYNSVNVPASLAVSRPELRVETFLDLGRSLNLVPVSAPLLIFNRGIGDLVANLQVQAPWLSASSEQVTIPSGAAKAVNISADPSLLPDAGITRQQAAIIINSNAGTAEIDVRVEAEALPRLDTSPDRLVLKPQVEGTIIVRNTGLGILNARATSSQPWLNVTPKQLTVKPGRRARLSVLVESMPEETDRTGFVIVEANEQRQQIEVIVI